MNVDANIGSIPIKFYVKANASAQCERAPIEQVVADDVDDLPEPIAPGVLDPPMFPSPLEMGVNMLLVPGVYRLLVGVYAATQEPISISFAQSIFQFDL